MASNLVVPCAETSGDPEEEPRLARPMAGGGSNPSPQSNPPDRITACPLKWRPPSVTFLLNFFDELRRRVPAGK